MSQFSDVIKNRYSVRSFTNQPVEQEKIDAIIQAGMDAPTAVNAQPIKIWVLPIAKAIRLLSVLMNISSLRMRVRKWLYPHLR